MNQEAKEKLMKWKYELGKILETYALPGEAYDVVKDIYIEIEGVLG